LLSKHLFFYKNFGPYHLARLEALQREIPSMMAVECEPTGGIYYWGILEKQKQLRYRTLYKEGKDFNLGAAKKEAGIIIQEVKPESVVVVGYSEPVMRHIATFARRVGAIIVLYIESTWFDKKRVLIKEIIKKAWIKSHYDCALVAGERSHQYANHLGFSDDRIWRCGNVVDNEHFAVNANGYFKTRDSTINILGSGKKYFLCVCRLSPEKNLKRLVEAFALYQNKGGAWGLVIVGSGPQEEELKSYIKNNDIEGIKLVPWKQYDELPLYYASSSCLILPSISEPWGLVVNEAMACGLPVLVSRKCGCVPELCRRGVNGYDFDPYNPQGLAQLMLKMSGDEVDLDIMGAHSKRIISNYTPETWAMAVKDCVETVIERRKVGK
jgi:glycosyltransferase involved in cell wall biosynthesis